MKIQSARNHIIAQFHRQSMRQRLSFLLIGLLTCASAAQAQKTFPKEGYIESNWGLASIQLSDTESVFPGTSLLAGGRTYFTERAFVEGQLGLAFPSLVTGKVGAGKKWDSGWSGSAGIRLFPAHAYVATGIPTERCNRDISPAKQRKLERRGLTTEDLKCSEWVFSIELSMYGLGYKVMPELRDRVDYNWKSRWASSSLSALGMVTVGHRWMF